MTINLEEETRVPFRFNYKELAQTVIAHVIDQCGFPYEAEVNLLLTDNEGIRKINKNFRQMDRATDVLSFPLISYEEAGDFSRLEADLDNFNPDTGEALLGDIVISVDKVLEQAESFGHSQEREYAFLIVHSMLHLFGYDHMEPTEATVMEQLQEELLNEMNITR